MVENPQPSPHRTGKNGHCKEAPNRRIIKLRLGAFVPYTVSFLPVLPKLLLGVFLIAIEPFLA